MIIKGKAIDELTGGGAGKYCAVLFYGPDEGRVRENALLAARSICGDLADPFRVVSLDGAEIKADPARLADEAAAISMTGGRRVLRLRNISDAVAPVITDFVQNPAGDSVIIAEAGELPKTSKLRKLFETTPVCAIAACYEDNPEDLAALITRHLRQNHLTITSEAGRYLQSCLGEDRLATRHELDKLVTYMGPPPDGTRDNAAKATGDIAAIPDTQAVSDITAIPDVMDSKAVFDSSGIQDTADAHGVSDVMDTRDVFDPLDTRDVSDIRDICDIRDIHAAKDVHGGIGARDATASNKSKFLPRQVTLQDVKACIGDTSSQGFDDICDAMALGDPVNLDYRLSRGFEASLSPVAILRAASNHLIQLHLALGMIAQGNTQEQALRSTRPPLHFSRAADFRQQLRIWDLPRLTQALDLLLQAESICKSSLAADDSVCSSALHQAGRLTRPNLNRPASPLNPRVRH